MLRGILDRAMANGCVYGGGAEMANHHFFKGNPAGGHRSGPDLSGKGFLQIFRRRSVLFTWALSYGILLALMAVLCMALSHNVRQQLVDEYKVITQTLQQQTNDSMANYFDELESCAYEVGNDYLVNDFVATTTFAGGAKYYNLIPIQQSLSVYALQANGSVTRYLYMSNIQRALTANTIYQQDDFFEALNLSDAMSEEEFYRLLSEYHYNEFFVFDSGGQARVLLLTSIPMVGSQPKGTLVSVLDAATISEMIQANSAVEDSTTVLMNGSGKIISAAGNSQVALLLSGVDISAAHNSEIELNGAPYWMQREALSQIGWDLVTVVPMASIQAKSSRAIHSVFPVMVCIILGAAALCLFFLYIQYMPLNQLQQKVGIPNDGNTRNEYDRLWFAFNDISSSKEQIQALWEDQTQRLRQEFVQSCIEGNAIYDEARLQQILTQLDVVFLGDWFSVLIFDFADHVPAYDDVERFVQSLSASEAQNISIYLFNDRSAWILLMNAANASALRFQMEHFCASLSAEADKRGLNWAYACSQPSYSLKNIHLAYLEAIESLRYQQDKLTGKASAAQASYTDVTAPYLPREQEDLLVRYVTAGNREAAGSLLNLIIRHNWEERALPLDICRCIAYDLLCNILRALGKFNGVLKGSRDVVRADLHALRHSSSKEELAAILNQAVGQYTDLCSSWHNAAVIRKKQPIDRIIDCVNEHYRDLDFNVSRAAEYLGMSMPYLSNLFKQQTGINLLNYINGLRVKYAKQCILEQHITVAQAAQQAGFENINTFIRIFKKYEGTTPGNIKI